MRYWFLWLLAGIISLIGGIFALANPLAATLTSVMLAGWMFVMVGLVTIISAFGDRGWGGRILAILLGLALLFLGISLLGHPLKGMVSLTFLVGAMMLVLGVFRILIGLTSRANSLRGVMILSGIISLILGFMIFSNWPQSAAVILGIFLAVELISNGISLIVLSLSRKSGEEAAA